MKRQEYTTKTTLKKVREDKEGYKFLVETKRNKELEESNLFISIYTAEEDFKKQINFYHKNIN